MLANEINKIGKVSNSYGWPPLHINLFCLSVCLPASQLADQPLVYSNHPQLSTIVSLIYAIFSFETWAHNCDHDWTILQIAWTTPSQATAGNNNVNWMWISGLSFEQIWRAWNLFFQRIQPSLFFYFDVNLNTSCRRYLDNSSCLPLHRPFFLSLELRDNFLMLCALFVFLSLFTLRHSMNRVYFNLLQIHLFDKLLSVNHSSFTAFNDDDGTGALDFPTKSYCKYA